MKTTSIRNTSFALLGLGIFVIPAIASFDGIANSVHFYSESFGDDQAIDFGRAPIAVHMTLWTSEPARAGSLNETGWDFDRVMSWDTKGMDRVKKLLAQARNHEVAGRFKQSLAAYAELPYDHVSKAFIKDREELFRTCGYRNKPGLQEYLKARYILEFESGKQWIEAGKQLVGLSADGAVAPHIAYARAGLDRRDRSLLAERYLDAYNRFPKSPRAESALIMAARSLLQDTPEGKPSAEQVDKAGRVLNLLLNKFPQTRFRHNAYAWQGHCAYLRGQFADAAGFYVKQSKSEDPAEVWKAYRSLADVSWSQGRRDRAVIAYLRQWKVPYTASKHVEGAYDLRQLFQTLRADEVKRAQEEIRRDPDLLEAYVGFRIEHTEMDPGEEKNLMAFATNALGNLSRPPVKLVARVAQINYNAGHYDAAYRMASRAMKQGDPETRARARFVAAGSLARLGKAKQAIRTGEPLLQRNVPAYLRQSAAEFLALLHERHGDPVRALELYQRLDYQYDAAFMADAKLTPEQLSTGIARLGRRTEADLVSSSALLYSNAYYGEEGDAEGSVRDVMIYTLGMRYLRQDRYAEARRAFQRLPKAVRSRWGLTEKQADGFKDWYGYDKPPKRRDPIEIVDHLDKLTRQAKSAKTADHRAQALYDKAAYIYKERNLLFYSPGLWNTNRSFAFGYFWNREINNQDDENALVRHCNEHECLAHSLRMWDELVTKYPKSPLVPKALYSAALAAYKLQNMNSWWRTQKNLGLVSINRLDRLIRDFPDHELAKPATKYRGVFANEWRKGGRY